MSNEEKLVSHYRLKTLLRRDGFGAVYLAEDTRDQKELILRVIELDQKTLAAITGRVRARSQRDHPLIEQIRQRMKRISELKNSHILSVIEFGEEHIQGNNDIIFYMASPAEKESLLAYWSARTSGAELLSLEIVAELLVQAGEALLAVHKRGLIHQYVRLSSFMLRSTTRGRKNLHLLLTDFWFADISAAILEEGQMAQSLSVYLAPEQLATGKAVAASDQYALAVLAYELLLGYRLSAVNLDLMLYEDFARQRSSAVSESDLILARNIDLVLRRALSENPAARFHTIEEFALTFRSASRGEATELLTDETVKIPVQRKHTAGIVEAAAGAIVAGEIVEGLASGQETVVAASESTTELVGTAQSSEEVTQIQRSHVRGLHKTVLTSEGMEAVTFEQSDTQETTQVAEAGATGLVVGEAAGFAAGLVAGEALGEAKVRSQEAQLASASTAQSSDIAEENTLIMGAALAGGAAGLVAGEILANEGQTSAIGQTGTTGTQQTGAEESTLIAGAALAGGAAGLVAGEILANEGQTSTISQTGATNTQQTGNIAEESTLIAGAALAGGAAGLVAGEILANEGQTSSIGQTGATSTQQTGNIAEESTLIAGAALAGGAAGLIAGEILASEGQSSTIGQTSGTGTSQTSNLAEEDTLIMGAALAGGAAGLIAGEILASEGQSSTIGQTSGAGVQQAGQIGQIGATNTQQTGNIAEESTLIAGAALAAGAAGLVAGEMLASEGQAGLMGQAGTVGSGRSGETILEETILAAGVAGATLAGGATQQAGGGMSGGAGVGGATLAGSVAAGGLVGAGSGAAGVGGATLAGGVAAGGLVGAGSGATGVGGATLAGGAVAGGVVGAGSGAVGGIARRRRRPLLIAASIALIVLLAGGGSAYAAFAFFGFMNQSSATVTLTLQSHTIQTSFLVTALASTTGGGAAGQVQARTLSATISQSKSGQASGFFAGVHASGFITFRNTSMGCGCPVVIPAGTVLRSGSGMTIITDTVASVASLCSVTVRAHAASFGSQGNIKVGDVNVALSPTMSATNPFAFSGGQGGQSNSLIQQSDIDHVSVALQSQVTQTAQASITSQLQSNEHLLHSPTCLTQTISDHPAGAVATAFNVTVSTTCTAEAYDYASAVQWTQDQIQAQATTYFGSAFVLVGAVQTQVTSATLVDAQTGKILLQINASGTWSYQFSNSQKHSLAATLAGKDVTTERTFMMSTIQGVKAVDIAISGRDQSKFPTDASNITIVIKN